MTSRRVALMILTLSLVVSACGSTNEKSESGAKSGAGKDADVAAKGGQDAAGPVETTPEGAPVASGDAAKPGVTTKSGAASGSGSGATPASGPAQLSPGVTKTELLIGITYASNAEAANAAFGYGGIGQIDFRKVYDAVIAEINKSGGVAGRKLKPIFYVQDGSDFSTTVDTHDQRSCAAWTEDNRVFVAFNDGDVLNACLAKKGIPQILPIGGGDTAEFKKYPKLFSVAGAASDRIARFVVDRLDARGYYKGAKLGVVIYTTPTYERAGKVMIEELAKRNVTPAEVAYIKPRAATQGAGDEIAAIRSAVLKFKTSGITHVQFVADASAWVQLNFMKAAQDQQFFPRYGLNSNDGGQALATLIGPDSRPQLKNALGVGWFPIFDVRAQDQADSAPLARCKKIARDAGQDFSDPTRNTEAQAAGICDPLFFLKEAMAKRPTVDVTYDAFKAGAELVKGFAVANTFRSSMSATRHDGVGSIRLTQWFTDCECFKYVSAEQSI